MLCKVCEKNETGRLMDVGLAEKVPVCTACLTSGRWKELIPEPSPDAPESITGATNDLVCSVCGKECKSSFGLKSHMRTHK